MAVDEVKSDAEELVRAGRARWSSEGRKRRRRPPGRPARPRRGPASGSRRRLDGRGPRGRPRADAARRRCDGSSSCSMRSSRSGPSPEPHSPHAAGARRPRQGVARRGTRRPASHPDRARPRHLGRALAVEGLRGDLEWLSVLVSRLDREPPHRQAAFLEVELERVRNGSARRRVLAGRRLPTRIGCDRGATGCRASSSSGGSGASSRRRRRARRRSGSWGSGFQLSRLQARVASLEPGEDEDGQDDVAGGRPRGVGRVPVDPPDRARRRGRIAAAGDGPDRARAGPASVPPRRPATRSARPSPSSRTCPCDGP